MTAFDCLPLETFVEILKNTDGITVGKSRRVCKHWKEVIDGSDSLWQQICENEFRCASKIARKKCGYDCSWYHIYKNLKTWRYVTNYERKMRNFYKFSLHGSNHALDISYNVLPLRDHMGVVMYDVSSLKYIPVAIPDRTCTKISNNENVTAVLVKSGLYIQRTVENNTFTTEAFFNADNFVLCKDFIYFYKKREVYKCDLRLEDLESVRLFYCTYDIKFIEQENDIIYIFTVCGHIINVYKDLSTQMKSVSIPIEWVKQIRHIYGVNDKNFVCYSRDVFKIETDRYEHLYLDLPIITALFFYTDIVLMGTKIGEVLMYQLSRQSITSSPKFDHIAKLPEGKFAVQIDVCERKSGPVIVIATFFEIFLVEIDFFPREKAVKSKFPPKKLLMYKRFLKIRDRLQTINANNADQ